jgi:hypothetical protein
VLSLLHVVCGAKGIPPLALAADGWAAQPDNTMCIAGYLFSSCSSCGLLQCDRERTHRVLSCNQRQQLQLCCVSIPSSDPASNSHDGRWHWQAGPGYLM